MQSDSRDSVRDRSIALTNHCRNEVDKRLQTVFIYSPDGGEIVFAREDVREESERADFIEFSRAAFGVSEAVSGLDTNAEVGEHLVTIHQFENIFAFQFVLNQREGIVASFDVGLGSELEQFSEECSRAIKNPHGGR